MAGWQPSKPGYTLRRSHEVEERESSTDEKLHVTPGLEPCKDPQRPQRDMHATFLGCSGCRFL